MEKLSLATVFCTLLLSSLSCGCSILTVFEEPPPKAYSNVPMFSDAAKDHPVRVGMCSNSGSSPHDRILSVLVLLANYSQIAWTIDAGQISVCPDPASSGDGPVCSAKWLPMPAEEAARIAPIPLAEGLTAMVDKAGIFATYGAGLGAAGGAFAANAKGGSVDSGFQLGAAYGAVVMGAAGLVFEYVRLSHAYETKEAGDANEKMKFLALKDRSILYSGYSTVGYVYFLRDTIETRNRVTVRLVRGDPSKDWLPPSFNQVTNGHFDKEPPPERPLLADASPFVCECAMTIPPCSKSPRNPVEPDGDHYDFSCTAFGGKKVDCGVIGNEGFDAWLSTDKAVTSAVLEKSQ